jgi:hypothetical protein
MKPENRPATDGAKLDFKESMSYGDYLHLDAILGACLGCACHHDATRVLGDSPLPS